MASAHNNRKSKRRHLIYYLKVFDNKTGQLLGHLVDLTPEGIMLVSEQPVEKDVTFTLRMTLPKEMRVQEEIIFEGICMWSKKDINPDYYASGFQTTMAEQDDIKLFEDLIKRYGFSN